MSARAVESWTLQPLTDFVREAAVRLVLLMTPAGQVLAQSGFSRAVDVMSAAALGAAIIASTTEMAKQMKQAPFAFLSHQGQRHGIFLASSATARGPVVALVFTTQPQTTTATTTASVTSSTTSSASVTTTGNGAPSGSHYNLNIIGVPKDKTADMNNNDGHRIFVQLYGGSAAGDITGKNFTDISKVNTILLAPAPAGSSFQVLDANATDKNGAVFQLPPDVSTTWTVDPIAFAVAPRRTAAIATTMMATTA